jgi:hypothetical protein
MHDGNLGNVMKSYNLSSTYVGSEVLTAVDIMGYNAV